MDAAKSKLHQRYSNMIRTAARIGGSADPKVNMKLKAAIEEAKAMNVRKEVIDRALEKAQNAKIVPCILEIQGPGGCFFVANCETDNVSTLRHDIKKLLRKTKRYIIVY
ncbi:putative transcriptional regulatory protein-like protein [Leptotrombidium deliense]|uniref:Putative transcriptional regulatory protein-like protein n=1 Tax=Leptotrombidium deliense TaxID=299467 RepID=A0A443SB69_9ACAR|nr:putative transcriptional regulatory protein-like protein [Leptotrombidium deliense]